MKTKKTGNKNQGFTLAEILITLTIIGFVAAMTIPAIIKSYNDIQYRTSWRKVISEVNQFYKLSKADGYAFDKYGEQTIENTTFNKFILLGNYLNAQIKCTGSANDTVGKCWANNVDLTNLNGCAYFSANIMTRYGFVTNDGMYWILYSWLWPIVAVDLNGPRGPNEWGEDILTFPLTNDHIMTEGGMNYGVCLKAGVPNKALNYLTNN